MQPHAEERFALVMSELEEKYRAIEAEVKRERAERVEVENILKARIQTLELELEKERNPVRRSRNSVVEIFVVNNQGRRSTIYGGFEYTNYEAILLAIRLR